MEFVCRRLTGKCSWDPHLGEGKNEAPLVGEEVEQSHRPSEGLSQPHREFWRWEDPSDPSGLGQEGRAFILHLDQALRLDGSGREVQYWVRQLSSTELIPKGGWAERIKHHSWRVMWAKHHNVYPRSNVFRCFAVIQGNPQGPGLSGGDLKQWWC